MRRFFLLGLICFLCLFSLQGQETTQTKVVAGFNGGMMVHTGYLQGTLQGFGYRAQGAPFGLGGGTQTTFLLLDGSATDWTSEQNAVFHKQGFCAITPFVGCDFILTKVVHLTLKADWLNTISHTGWIKPTGPRFYFGVIFYH